MRVRCLAAGSEDGLSRIWIGCRSKQPLEPACDPEGHGLHYPRSAQANSPTVGFDRSKT